MKSPEAQKLLKKILDDLDHAGIITNTLVNDLQKLRPFAVEEKEPVIAKAIRLAYEHIEAYGTFDIPIPKDEPIDELEVDFEMHEGEDTEIEVKPEESLSYLISLMKDADNRLNLQEIREFNEAMMEYAEEN
ncbi:MAG TPA: hypothetical protein VFM82_05465 [Flavobacteriaceae bacterium]|nr:hypothetical protein [Flavobacteriaceae bacterium]